MEVIRKTILLEPYISREHSLIPYIGQTVEAVKRLKIEDFPHLDNWGEYPYDIDIDKCEPFESDDMGTITPSELKKYFFGYNGDAQLRVSFKELAEKTVLMRDIIKNMVFYKLIEKRGSRILVSYDTNIYHGFAYEIYDSYEDLYDKINELEKDAVYGVSNKHSFSENGGHAMLRFLLKAMGCFIVPFEYISDNNGVPHVMCFSGIDDYIEKMNRARRNTQCCFIDEFFYLGGDSFLSFLQEKKRKINSEISYWQKSLFTDEGYNAETFINFNVLLTEDYHNIGQYTPLYLTDEIHNGGLVKEHITVSQLKHLRKSAITYSEYFDSETETYKTHEFPLILEDIVDANNELTGRYRLKAPYDTTCFRNITENENGEIYGDIIYKVKYNEEFNFVDVYYAIGAELNKTERGYVLADNETSNNEVKSLAEYLEKSDMDLTVDDFLFLKEEFGEQHNFNDNVILVETPILNLDEIAYPDKEDVIYVYNITNSVINIDGLLKNGYFIITKLIDGKQEMSIFNTGKITQTFSGSRFLERIPYNVVDYTNVESNEFIRQLRDDKIGYVNILADTNIVVNADNAAVMDLTNMPEEVHGVFYDITKVEKITPPSIMFNQDFGMVETIIDNPQDVLIDRGFVSTYELHYKMGEINTLEDMENYQNNYFGL